MKLYKIVDWSKHFENHRTRDMKKLTYLCVPNKQDGDGYTELFDHPNGTAHFGAFMALAEAASKVGDGVHERGVLLRENGQPYDERSLARVTRVPIEILREALPRLIEIGWLSSEVYDEKEVASDRHEDDKGCPSSVVLVSPDREQSSELNGLELSSFATSSLDHPPTKSRPDPEAFSKFWESYPSRHGKRTGKAAAKALFGKLSAADAELCIRAAAFYAKSTQAHEGFARDPERFLKKQFWRDWLDPEVLEKPTRVLTAAELDNWNPTDGGGIL